MQFVYFTAPAGIITVTYIGQLFEDYLAHQWPTVRLGIDRYNRYRFNPESITIQLKKNSHLFTHK